MRKWQKIQKMTDSELADYIASQENIIAKGPRAHYSYTSKGADMDCSGSTPLHNAKRHLKMALAEKSRRG